MSDPSEYTLSGWLQGTRVLVAQGELDDARRCVGWLAEAGAIVTHLHSVPDVLAALETERDAVQLVVLDLALPGGDPLRLPRETVVAQRSCATLIRVKPGELTDPRVCDAVHTLRRTGFLSMGAGRADLVATAVRLVQLDMPSLSRFVSYALRRWKLSSREAKVVLCSLWGFTDRQIATTLGVSVFTVQQYQVTIRRKTGAPSKASYLRLILEAFGLAPPNC